MTTEKLRDYNLDFNPKFLYSKSKATTELSNSKASQYLEFISMKKIFVNFDNKFLSVPCTKSEIFASNDLELIEKQKLLHFIYAIMKIKNTDKDVNTTIDIKKDYEVGGQILEDIKANLETDSHAFLKVRFTEKLRVIIKLILANIEPNNEEHFTLDQLIGKIHKYLISLQVYDDSPFLYPIYGSSEFSQALSRVSSVFGSTFIVNDNLTINVHENNEYYVNQIDNKKYLINVHDKSNLYLFIYLLL